MEKINFEDGELVKEGYVEIDGVQHLVQEAQYNGNTPLSAYTLNKIQENVEEEINSITTRVQELEKYKNILYEKVLTEDITSIVIPAANLTEDYRIEITGVITAEGYSAIRANTENCNSGIIVVENNVVSGQNWKKHWGCFIAKTKVGYLNAIVDVLYNTSYNGFSYTSQFSVNSIANELSLTGQASGAQYSTGKNYHLTIVANLKAGSKIVIRKI